jgi:hypothetical protein
MKRVPLDGNLRFVFTMLRAMLIEERLERCVLVL